jgi:two-component sensor histidine kinase
VNALTNPVGPADAAAPSRRRNITSRQMLVTATLFLWAANFFIFTMISVLDRPDRWMDSLLPRIVLTIIGIGFCYLLHLVLRAAGKKGFRVQMIAAIVAAPIVADLYGWCNALAAALIYGQMPQLPLGETIFQLSLHLWFFASWIGFYLAISYSMRLRQQEKREATTRFLAQAAQLQALHYQINPHFLFNTLNAISSLIVDGRNAEAEAMVQRLSEFFRLTLELDPRQDVSLERELALQAAYLDIEKVRFPDMTIRIDVGDDVRAAAVPGLILQPLVENAVKHGVARNPGPSHIEISAHRAAGNIEVEIANRASSRASEGGGIGLRNVRERLVARFGDLASLTAGFTGPKRYSARLVMPLVPVA